MSSSTTQADKAYKMHSTVLSTQDRIRELIERGSNALPPDAVATLNAQIKSLESVRRFLVTVTADYLMRGE